MPKSGLNIGVGIAIVIAIAIGSWYALSHSPDAAPLSGSTVNGGNVTDYTAVNTTAGYWVNGSQIVGPSGILASALAVFDGGVLNSYTNSTSTVLTTQTLVASDITNYSTVVFKPNTGAVTLTLPASSTLSSFVPTAGDWLQQCWLNSTTTANTRIIFAAGTGIDLEVASSTASAAQGAVSTNLSINTGNSGCFRFVRKADTDIIAQFTSFVDGD